MLVILAVFFPVGEARINSSHPEDSMMEADASSASACFHAKGPLSMCIITTYTCTHHPAHHNWRASGKRCSAGLIAASHANYTKNQEGRRRDRRVNAY